MPGRDPIKLLIVGSPGIGKTELAEHLARALGVGRFERHKFNGTSFRMEDCEDLSRTVHYTTMSGGYRLLQIEEVDRVPATCQVRVLSLLDDLPPGNAVVATSNCRVADLEPRFQRRFQVIELKPPSEDEICDFLCRLWHIPAHTSAMIAMGSCGSVGQALMDANTALV